MTTTNELFLRHKDSAGAYAREYGRLLAQLLAELDYDAVERVAGAFDVARRAGRTIFLLGNGGSATTASHFVNDLAHGPYKEGCPPFRALSLSDNMSFFSAIANDCGYDKVFVNQLRTLMVPGDVVVGISASGNSPNILEALAYAARQGGVTVGLLGFDGGKAAELCRHAILIRTPRGEYGLVESMHLVLDHMLASYLKCAMESE